MQGLRIDCGAGATDGSGFLALLTGNVIEPSNASVHFLAPDGALLSQSPSTNASLTGQLSGFEGQVWADEQERLAHRDGFAVDRAPERAPVALSSPLHGGREGTEVTGGQCRRIRCVHFRRARNGSNYRQEGTP
jgi:hypothetical protein